MKPTICSIALIFLITMSSNLAAINAPTAYQPTVYAQTSFTATWSSVSGASSYRLDVSKYSNFSSMISGYNNLTVSSTSKNVTGLTANTTYYFRVRAYSSGGTSVNSNVITVVTLPNAPGAPTASAATNIKTSSFTANWGSVSGATEYLLDVSVMSNFTTSFIYHVSYPGLTANITGLTAHTNYYYRVYAKNAGGTSSASNVISTMTAVAAPVASAATSVSTTSFTANWGTVSYATAYYFDLSTDVNFTSFVSSYNNFSLTSNSLSISGLSANTTYYYRVRATDATLNQSDNSGGISVTTAAPLPAIPVANSATNIVSTSFVANWGAVAYATEYLLDVSLMSDFTTSFIYHVSYPGTSATISGLSPHTNYYYRVYAKNSSGTSGNSNVITVITAVAAPVITTPDNVLNSSFTANWNAVPNAIGYYVDVSASSDFSSYIGTYHDLSLGSNTINISGLNGSTQYYYRIRATDGSYNKSDYSTVASVTTLANIPAVPVLSDANSVNITSFRAGWVSVPVATGYYLDVSTSSSFTSFVGVYHDFYTTANYADVTGLSASTTYYFRARSTNIYGNSDYSSVKSVTTLPFIPVAPTPMAATNVGLTSLTFNWSYDSGVTSYLFDVAIDNAFQNLTYGLNNLTLTTNSYSTIGLVPNTTYYFRVKAFNQNGSSSYSTTGQATTLAVPPAGISSSSVTTTSITANWTAVPGISQYNLELATDISFVNIVSGYNGLVVNTNSAILTGLQSGTNYYFRVRSLNAGGLSDYSDTGTAMTQLINPVSSSATSINSTSFSANWSSVTGAAEYLLDVSTSSSFTSYITWYNGSSATSFNVTGLMPSTTYYYRVQARNSLYSTSYSGTISATTLSSSGSVEPQYNGNISSVRWTFNGITSSDPQINNLREYDFTYDHLNRLKGARYLNITDAAKNNTYNEDNISYDLNGNILTLSRRGYDNSYIAHPNQDVMTYTYLNGGNKLATVTDAGDVNLGFIDGNTSGDDYTYDENGNMTLDRNKGFTIEYNVLNLPSRVSKGSDYIVYIYDASGSKLRKEVYTGGSLTSWVDYCGEAEFMNNQLKYLHTEEGMAENMSGSNTYEYFIKDNLGNTRALISADGSGNVVVGQSKSYYPFGESFAGGNLGSDNKYMYNGKELQVETLGTIQFDWYDYGARFYDPQIGRWHSIDKYSDHSNQISKSPYQYAWNDPIKLNDPDGNCPWCVVGAIVGAAVDYGSQVVQNYVSGVEHPWTNVNGATILVSATAGFLSGGISSLLETGTITTTRAVLSTMTVNAVESMAKQGAKDEDIDPTQVAIDVTAGQIADGINIKNILPTKGLEYKLDRAIRVAGNTPRLSRATAVSSAKRALNAVKNTNQVAKATAKKVVEESISDIYQTHDNNYDSNNNNNFMPFYMIPLVMPADNTRVVRN